MQSLTYVLSSVLRDTAFTSGGRSRELRWWGRASSMTSLHGLINTLQLHLHLLPHLYHTFILIPYHPLLFWVSSPMPTSLGSV